MKADLIIKSNAIFDSINEKPFTGYVAVKDNKIAKVSKDENYQDLVGSDTIVKEYKDKLVMTGFHDSHTHLIMAGMFGTYVNLFDAKSEEEAVEMIKDYVEKNGIDGEWIIGFSWYHAFWDNKTLPTKASLDAAFPDTPVFLVNAEAHGAWVNSKALELAGINKDTPDPFGGEITRDENGEATGFLYESATGLVGKCALVFTPEQEKQIINAYQKTAAQYGITSLNDVQPYFHGNMGALSVYSDMDKNGELSVRIHAAPDLIGDLDEVEKAQKAYTSDRLKIDMLKQFLDGVCTTHTALVLEDYSDAPGKTGIALTDVEAIEKAIPEAHKRGFSIKLHSCGDRSLRMALDYYENAYKLHGDTGVRHAIEHCEMVSDSDMPRFGQLGIIPSVQPEHIALTQKFSETPYLEVLGKERAGKTWPLKSLLNQVGEIAIGSDCPVVDNNPFIEIFRAVTRVFNDGEPKGGWNPTEKLSLYETLRGYTYGSAYGIRREKEMGSLEEGKFADIAVIDRNLFEVPEKDIYDA
ncbi:MAG: amidohydrolase, partial [Anaerovoracaceae bacterium]